MRGEGLFRGKKGDVYGVKVGVGSKRSLGGDNHAVKKGTTHGSHAVSIDS